MSFSTEGKPFMYRFGAATMSLILTMVVMIGTFVLMHYVCNEPLMLNDFEAGVVCGGSVLRFLDTLLP